MWLITCPSESVLSGREGSERARIKVISLVYWQELTTQDCLVNLNRMSMRIKCFADEQNFIKEKNKSYVFSECYKHICNQRSQL
jgi:hypothetical protein